MTKTGQSTTVRTAAVPLSITGAVALAALVFGWFEVRTHEKLKRDGYPANEPAPTASPST